MTSLLCVNQIQNCILYYAIYVLRSTVDYYVSFGTTVNICALDLSKAFDKMNHHGLFING